MKRPSTTASAALVLHDVLDAHGSPAAYGLRELGRELLDEHLSEDLDLDGAEAWEETTASFSLLAAVRGGDGARSARARTRADRAARLELAELFVREQPERRVTVLEEPAELEVLRRRHAPHPRIDHAPLPGDEECGSHGAPQESFDAVVLAMELTPRTDERAQRLLDAHRRTISRAPGHERVRAGLLPQRGLERAALHGAPRGRDRPHRLSTGPPRIADVPGHRRDQRPETRDQRPETRDQRPSPATG
ncbi:hypothetical protein [Kocuria sp. UBA5001]|uniref:hypothetical protein n=1 Tax=Kocuria sp. UBA5001 TaxID=1946674 RepID=UPI0025C448C8|nr:hypothetical protein [Kocuria sp. UBA5001]